MNERFVANGYHLSTNFNKTFVKIFEQNYNENKNNMFVDNDEANFSLKKNKFSVLKYISDVFFVDSDKNYEYIIFYKELDIIHHWTQNWSIHEIPVHAEYVPLHTNSSMNKFEGLAPSNGTDASLIDGLVYSNEWWYSIGLKHLFSTTTAGTGIPGPFVVVNSVSLWMRIIDITLLDKLPKLLKSFTCMKRYHSFNILLSMCLLLLYSRN